MLKQIISRITLCCLAGLVFLTCDEALPSRGDPQDLLTCTIEAAYSSVGGNSYKVYVKAKNNYDETLQGYAIFGGQLEFVWEKDPSFRKTVVLDRKYLFTNGSRFYDASQNTITLDPGAEVSFFYEWKWDTDNGDTLTKHFDLKRDDTCPVYTYNSKGKKIGFVFPRWSSKETFVINAQVKLFRELSSSQGPRTRQIIEYETYPNTLCSRFSGSAGR